MSDMSETSENEKRVALVTGASRGIGAAIAKAIAAQGRHVVLMARSEDKLNEVKAEIEAAGGEASVLTGDISDHAALENSIKALIKEKGRLDILVNNAGITRDNLMMRMKDEEFDEVMHVNLRAAFITCRAVMRPMMKQKFGRIVNIASVSGVIGNPGQANYAAAKAGLIGMTKCMAKELAGKQVTANVVAPGFIESDMTKDLPDAVKEFTTKVTPMGRFGQVEEIAAAVAHLTSDEASYTTGQVLKVDGGMTMC